MLNTIARALTRSRYPAIRFAIPSVRSTEPSDNFHSGPIEAIASPRPTRKRGDRPDGCLKQIDVPTLAIQGDDDQTVPFPNFGQLQAKLIQSAELKVCKSAPHGLCTTHKNRVSADLEFVELSVGPSSSFWLRRDGSWPRYGGGHA